MGLADIYRKGERLLREKEFGFFIEFNKSLFCMNSGVVNILRFEKPVIERIVQIQGFYLDVMGT